MLRSTYDGTKLCKRNISIAPVDKQQIALAHQEGPLVRQDFQTPV